MRTFKLIAGLSFLLLVVACQDKKRSSQIEVAENESKYVVLAYVTSWGESTPDPACLTHINYAFGHVTDNFKGIRIDNEPRLQMVVGLREKKPSLKVLLSVGGWGSSRFSEMAQTDSTRMAFAADCKRVIDQFDLDGIDIDWEYPGIGTAGVSFSPEDTDNFSLLMKDIRHAIGKDKLLTIATQAGAKYYNLKAVEPYVDYVNIMTYDMEESPNHHSALYRSEMTEEWSCEDAVAAHVAAGFPVGRLVLGIPFYGHGTNEAPELLDYRHIIVLDSLQSCWDSAAQVPYMINSQGHVVVNYENAQSIAFKCQFLHQKGMLGAMYWDYDSDDENGYWGVKQTSERIFSFAQALAGDDEEKMTKMKEAFEGFDDLILCPVSNWVGERAAQSPVLRQYPICTVLKRSAGSSRETKCWRPQDDPSCDGKLYQPCKGRKVYHGTVPTVGFRKVRGCCCGRIE